MKNKKLKGFSLAELLISLLIISIVLSAAIPTITKRSGATRENIWNWSDQNNSIYATTGGNQSAILGLDRVPTVDWNTVLTDEENPASSQILDTDGTTVLASADISGSWAVPASSKITQSTDGNKLVILKRDAYPGESSLLNSHIAFFNTAYNGGSTDYVGRIAMDKGNIAFGIGTLQNQTPDALGENIAIGHYSLLVNKVGIRNTAIGRKSLMRNASGSYNTAIGFGTLADFNKNIDSASLENDSAPTKGFNTAIGALSQKANNTGTNNTAIGYSALLKNVSGSDNTAVGSNALSQLETEINTGDNNNNTALGNWACGLITKGKNNLCIGNWAGAEAGLTTVDYGLFIGTPFMDSSNNNKNQKSIITGHVLNDDNDNPTIDKELIVSAKKFQLQSALGKQEDDALFNFESYSGILGKDSSNVEHYGYEPYGSGFRGRASFNLRNIRPGNSLLSGSYSDSSNSITLQFDAPNSNRVAYINSFDKYYQDPLGTNKKFATRDINFNNYLTFDFPGRYRINDQIYTETNAEKVAIRAEYPIVNGFNDVAPASAARYPLVLNDLLEINQAESRIVFNNYKPAGASAIVPISISAQKLNYDIAEFTGTKANINFGGLGFYTDFTGSNKTTKIAILNNTNISSATEQLWLNFGTATSEPALYLKTTKRININSTSNDSEINFNDKVIIKAGDIKIDGITSSEGFVKAAINELANTINPSSDIRLKNVSGDNTAGLKEINALEVKNYTYKKDKKKTPHVGVIAQQLQKVFPDAVSKDKDGYLRIRTEDIFYAMVNSIKELCKQLQDLTAKVTGLDKRITELEKQNKELAEQNRAFEKRLAKLEKQASQK